MSNFADAPLLKVTLNLYAEDVQYFQGRYDQGYSKIIREVLHNYVVRKKHERAERADEHAAQQEE